MPNLIDSSVPDTYSGPCAPLPEILNQASELAESGRFAAAVDELRYGLFAARAAQPSLGSWKTAVDLHVRSHPTLAYAHENPFVWRCYSRPRGYAGDAVMLDFIYRHPAIRALADEATLNGRMQMEACLTTPAPRAVRNRCRLLADEIDAVCVRNKKAEILSLACGHLREAGHSAAVAEGRIGRFVALDQDEKSLATVVRDTAGSKIEAVRGSVKSVIASRPDELGQFDFIYSAGLYDYLGDRLAEKLLSKLFGMLKPGGKVWIANFAPNIPDVGFMEAVMDWWLTYRDAAAMQMLADGALAGRGDVASVRTFTETEGNIVFFEAVRG